MASSEKLLAGKVIIVTGAGSGIGAAVAMLAAQNGAFLVVNDLGVNEGGEGSDAGPARKITEAINATGGKAVASVRDVADWGSAQGIIDDALQAFGHIDGVVNNAGVVRDSIFHRMDEHTWDRCLQINLKGAFNVSRAAAPQFKSQQSGAFIHMSSSSGLIGNLGQANYAASKMGIVGLSKCIALDMARFNVRSNCIAPSAFTRLVGTIPEDKGDNAARLALVRQATPDRIAPFITSLLTDAAADITGQVFGVRMNEIFLYSQPRPIRTVHKHDGWTLESCIETAFPALRPSYYKLDRSADVFAWNPM
jgi:NAD(P)-dependent dehydrogenase (short-subunit alcohol dehydrogenase family)